MTISITSAPTRTGRPLPVATTESDPHRIGEQWLLTEYDTFVRNPHYAGPALPHPDEEDYPMDSAVAPEAGPTVHAGDRSQLVTPRPVPGLETQPLDEPPC